MTPAPRLPFACPPPPAVGDTDPLLSTYPAGSRLCRVHSVRWAGDSFNEFKGQASPVPARFSPFFAGGGTTVVPILYAAENLEGAVWETVFHDVPARGTAKRVPRSRLRDRIVSTVETTRPLRLVKLTSTGLSGIDVARTELIELGPKAYERTARWARMLHDCRAQPDGLLWVSRRQDTSVCVVLFGDRVAPGDVRLVPGSESFPIFDGEGYQRVATMADDARITITER